MNFNKPLILASKSPRRQQLLKEAGFNFEIKTEDVEESYPPTLAAIDVAKYLAIKKANAFKDEIGEHIVITADTVVVLDNIVLGKPKDAFEAKQMLQMLSGKSHLVVTGICIMNKEKKISFDETTTVFFKPLTEQEIDFYIEKYRPFDKAGAYGIQEWIGMIAIEKIEGGYFNVMGLPVRRVYESLQQF